MNTRLPHTRATVTLERDRPDRLNPCATERNRPIFEATIDYSAGQDYHRAVEEARRVCLTGCDFAQRKACFKENRHNDGVIAALTELERNGRPATVIRDQCGTTAGASMHYKHKEISCEPCRAAQAAKKRNRAVAECGTDSGYFRHKRVTKTEPCDACRTAHAEAEKRRAKAAA